MNMSNFPIWPSNAGWSTSIPAPAAGDSRANASAWFDAPTAGLSIVGDANAQARGLSVEQHTERVLEHLLGERDSRD